ncbi:MAG TPA: hypothetical protein VG843_03855 [Rhizomicrobium sp.]|nr:hypothetical protein [Rhizomicrobium sp.]
MSKKRSAVGDLDERFQIARRELGAGRAFGEALEAARMTWREYIYAKSLTDKSELDALGGLDHKSKYR